MGLWLHPSPLVLASQSSSRREILAAAGIPHEVDPANIDERLREQQLDACKPGQVAELLAREKALTVSARRPGAVVLGADQTLMAGEQRFSKPDNRTAARAQLMLLRNGTHELHSAMAITRDGVVLFEHCEVARLAMRAFSEAFLEEYLDSVGSAVCSSVGAYQLEKIGIQLFDRVNGDHSAILGLPVLPLLQFLRRQGLLMS